MNDITRHPSRNVGWGLFGDEFDNLFEGFFRPSRGVMETAGKGLVPAMDLVEHDNEYVVKAELPGVRKEDIDVTLQDGVLTINAETKAETEEKKGGRVIRQERRYGKYVRSMRLGAQVDESKVKANYKDGVLELVLPKAEEVKPKKINVDIK
jgi:HSP20 family protein